MSDEKHIYYVERESGQDGDGYLVKQAGVGTVCYCFQDDGQEARKIAHLLNQSDRTEAERDMSPEHLLQLARETGLREMMHGVHPDNAKAALARFVDAVKMEKPERPERRAAILLAYGILWHATGQPWLTDVDALRLARKAMVDTLTITERGEGIQLARDNIPAIGENAGSVPSEVMHGFFSNPAGPGHDVISEAFKNWKRPEVDDLDAFDPVRQIARAIYDPDAPPLGEVTFPRREPISPSRLQQPAQVGATVFLRGVKASLVVERAQREYEYRHARIGDAYFANEILKMAMRYFGVVSINNEIILPKLHEAITKAMTDTKRRFALLSVEQDGDDEETFAQSSPQPREYPDWVVAGLRGQGRLVETPPDIESDGDDEETYAQARGEARAKVEQAYRNGEPIEAYALGDPLSGWFNAGSMIKTQGDFLWDDYDYRVKE